MFIKFVSKISFTVYLWLTLNSQVLERHNIQYVIQHLFTSTIPAWQPHPIMLDLQTHGQHFQLK